MVASPCIAASAVEVDLGAIDTLPPAKGGSAGAPIELRPPAAIRAAIAKREAARRAAAERDAQRARRARAAEERRRADVARKAAAKRRAAEDRRKADAARRAGQARERAEQARSQAEQRKMAAREKARKAAEASARATARSKDLPKAETGIAVKSANKSERVAPPAAGEPAAEQPAAGKPAARSANRAPSGGKARIAFAKGSSQLSAAARRNMTPVIQGLSRNAESRLVIYAYASGDKARRLSLSRALAVRLHLIKSGIQGTRAEVRALGSNTAEKPVDRVDLVLVGR